MLSLGSSIEEFRPNFLYTFHIYILVKQHLMGVGSCEFWQGQVVQSVVSLTNSLRVILLTVLADSIYNILIFFAEKM